MPRPPLHHCVTVIIIRKMVFFVTGEDNELLIGWEKAGIIAVVIESRYFNAELKPGYNMEDLWTNWHRHCFTWKAAGSFKVSVFKVNILL